MTSHQDTYKEWIIRLVDEKILVDGVVDREVLFDKYPDVLTDEQIAWIEAQEQSVGSFHVGDKILVIYDGQETPEEVTVVSIEKDGVHLAPKEDEDSEYVADPDELEIMMVKKL